MEKLEVIRVYEATNGDVFFEHNNSYKERTNEEIEDLINKAKEIYKNGNYVKCDSTAVNFYNNYYLDEKFIGTSGLHILNNFDIYQNFIYLKSNEVNDNAYKTFRELGEMVKKAK